MVSAEEEDIAASYNVLLDELRLYNPELLVKERLLAVTKCDLIDSDREKEILKTLPKGVDSVLISSVAGRGLDTLKDMLWAKLHA